MSKCLAVRAIRMAKTFVGPMPWFSTRCSGNLQSLHLRVVRLRKRLRKDRPNTTITMRIPIDVVNSLKAIAPTRGFSGYQMLLKSYIGEGLRRDEAEFDQYTARKLAEALKRRGVAENVLRDALSEGQHGGD